MKKILILTLLACFSSTAKAATVECMFMSETKINTKGEWLSTNVDFMVLMNMFGDGLKIKLENSLLGNLDTNKPFLAGEVSRGKVYLMGSDMGIEGKLINVQGNEILIYDGLCNINFSG